MEMCLDNRMFECVADLASPRVRNKTASHTDWSCDDLARLAHLMPHGVLYIRLQYVRLTPGMGCNAANADSHDCRMYSIHSLWASKRSRQDYPIKNKSYQEQQSNEALKHLSYRTSCHFCWNADDSLHSERITAPLTSEGLQWY